MKTLLDKVREGLDASQYPELVRLPNDYDQEKTLAKSYSIFTYLVGKGYGLEDAKAERLAEIMEAFYLATSIHDDVVDTEDAGVRASGHSANERIVLGDMFFIEMSSAMADMFSVLPGLCRQDVIARFRHQMLCVAESQLWEEGAKRSRVSVSEALRQAELRGGSWGRLSVGVAAAICGAGPEESDLLSDAGCDLFIAMTVMDDMRDLVDDLKNGVYSIAPAHLMEATGAAPPLLPPNPRDIHVKKLVANMMRAGSLKQALTLGLEAAQRANARLDRLLDTKEGMSWFQLTSFFRIVGRQLAEASDITIAERLVPGALKHARV